MERRLLLALARESIASRLEGREAPELSDPALPPMRAGAFVTLTEGGRLRGCIGRLEAEVPLAETVRSMARSAAFGDPRFPRVTASELPALRIEITVLGPRRGVEKVSEIVVGRHGVYLSLGNRSAVFLPQVATEQGWDLHELLVHLCRKAGLPDEAWREGAASIEVFEGLAFAEKPA